MSETTIKTKLVHVVADAAVYCYNVENCWNIERGELIKKLTSSLAQIYLDFISIGKDELTEDFDFDYTSSFVDEDMYEKIRSQLSSIFGEHDTYLETFEEDMKYSETPIAATISESLADIFQPLYNFISAVKESMGENIEVLYSNCLESFDEYWSQTLCNVMRPLNNLRSNPDFEND